MSAYGLEPDVRAFDIKGPVTNAISDALNAALNGFAKALCNFVGDLVHGILSYSDKGLGIDFSVGWFKDNYERMMVGGFLMGLAIFVVQCIAAALRRNPQMMLTALGATLLGVFTSFVSLTLIMMISAAIDDWSGAVTGGASIADGIRDEIKGLPDKVGAIGSVYVAIGYLLFSFALFLVLVVRRLGIYIIALFIPVYAAGMGGGWTNGMMKRAAELLFVLLMSKLAIVATFTLGESMLVGDTSGMDAVIDALSGVLVMLMAAVSPLGVMYLVAFADGLLVGQLAAAGGAGRAGVTSSVNQVRGHNGHGGRTLGGRITGAGRGSVGGNARQPAGGIRGMGNAARTARNRIGRATGAARTVAGALTSPARSARLRGIRQNWSRAGGQR